MIILIWFGIKLGMYRISGRPDNPARPCRFSKNPVPAGLSGKMRPGYQAGFMKKSGKSGSGRILKMLIQYNPR